MEKTVDVQGCNFLQSIAIQCAMPVLIQHARMIPIHILFDDPAGVPHQASYICRPNHIDQVVKSLRRITPVAVPKAPDQGREEGPELKDPNIVRLVRGSAQTETEECVVCPLYNAAGTGISMDQITEIGDKIKEIPNMTGIELIAVERKRQIEKERFDANHDDQHINSELAWAAVCYAAPRPIYKAFHNDLMFEFVDPWPHEEDWDPEWDKRIKNRRGTPDPGSRTPKQTIRDLVKAGALIAAEIDRLLRLKND